MGRGKPERYMAVESCDKVKRNVFCRNYGECLDYTIRNKWPGFSCQNCECYEQISHWAFLDMPWVKNCICWRTTW